MHRNDRVMRCQYDDTGRLQTERWLDGTAVVREFRFQYDAAGQVVLAEDVDAAGNLLSARYDTPGSAYTLLGQAQSVQMTFATALDLPAVTLSAQFDAQGNRERLAVEIGEVNDLVNAYAYDNRNRMQYVVQTGQAGGHAVAPKAAVFEYDRSGLLSENLPRPVVLGGYRRADRRGGIKGSGAYTGHSAESS